MAAVELDILDPPAAGPSQLTTLRRRRRSRGTDEPDDNAALRSLPNQVGLRLLTSFTLPPKYDHLPVVTRLWLQSRVVEKATTPDGDVELELTGEARKITWRNFKIGVDLLRLLGPRTARLIFQYRGVLALPSLLYLLSVVAEGVVPAAAMWGSAQMLDLVEKSFAGPPSSWADALRVAATAIALEVLSYTCRDVFASCHTFMSSFSRYHLERLYISAKLNETMMIQGDDATFTEVVDEASVFAGFQHMSGIDCPPHDSWSMVSAAGELVSSMIALGLQTSIMIGTLRTAMRGSSFTTGNSILIGLSLAPMCFDFVCDKLLSIFPPYWYRVGEPDTLVQTELRTLREFSQGRHREELILFNLKPYILTRWDQLNRSPERMNWTYDPAFWFDVGRTGISELITNAFYVLLAVHAIPSTLTLGAIHLHRASAERMHAVLSSVKWKLSVTWQLPFFLAAMFESQEGPAKSGPQVNYEEHRKRGGMRIEARNLGLSYDGVTPVLQGINITVEPGESLAVVGFNGGGKTTLVRALLGLHSHSGTLLVNGIPFEDYDSVTLHARMSCLFQDYDRYDLTVRQNVGFGDTRKMHNDEALNGALARGGASALVKGIGGLERPLSNSKRGRPKYPAKMMGSKAVTPPGEVATRDASSAAASESLSGDVTLATEEGSEGLATTGIEGEELDDANPTPDMNAPTGLSGGQWQRIALSRAFMRHGETDLIILDEPSASLDARTEKELFETVHSLSNLGEKGSTTCILISHRFATVKKASKIAFVDQGRIVEYGTHTELMALDGRYAEMYNIQKSAFDD
ncbi:unnamed protein product [Cutaneotrichosporon oleaginosum]